MKTLHFAKSISRGHNRTITVEEGLINTTPESLNFSVMGWAYAHAAPIQFRLILGPSSLRLQFLQFHFILKLAIRIFLSLLKPNGEDLLFLVDLTHLCQHLIQGAKVGRHEPLTREKYLCHSIKIATSTSLNYFTWNH